MQMIRKHRAKACVLSVHGGNEKLNRAAVESQDVDILSHPGEKLNQVLMRFASENRVAIEFNAGSIIKMRGTGRVRALAELGTISSSRESMVRQCCLRATRSRSTIAVYQKR